MQFYREMLRQETRVEAFRKAISSAVRPGDTVLEIGAGVGTYSFFAADGGARRVWAVESDGVVAVAKTIAQINGYSDRVNFLRGWFPDTKPDETPDIVIFEDYPPRLIDRATHNMLCDLGDFVGDSTQLVPCRARLCAAPVSHPLLGEVTSSFEEDSDNKYGVDWAATRDYLLNTPMRIEVRPDALLADPQVLAEVEICPRKNSWKLDGRAEWRIEGGAELHGFVYYFELLVGGTWLTNRPGGDPGAWGHLFLPVEMVSLDPGSMVTASIGPDLGVDGSPGWLRWEGNAGDSSFSGHEFRSTPAQMRDLTVASDTAVPELDENLMLQRDVLSLVDGHRSVGSIVSMLADDWGHLGERRLREQVVRMSRPSGTQG